MVEIVSRSLREIIRIMQPLINSYYKWVLKFICNLNEHNVKAIKKNFNERKNMFSPTAIDLQRCVYHRQYKNNKCFALGNIF